MNDLSIAEYFAIAAAPRYRVSQRRRVRDAARQGMLVAIAAALFDCVWLVWFHPDAIGLILALNASIALVAGIGYVAIATIARRRPEAVVFALLIGIDAATITLGLGRADLALVAAGYVLLLPTIVSLVIPWATRLHASWLALHAVLVVGFAFVTPDTSVPAGAKDELLVLLIVATIVSQAGHVVNLRARVLSFVQIERIRGLNRQAKRDASRLDRLVATLEQAANHDALTGLGSRLALGVDLTVVRSRIVRQYECFGLLILDLDRFKAINDELGHLSGDGVLRATAQAVMRAMRPGDRAYRYGGEEFVILMRLTAPPEARMAAERIRRAIDDLQIPNARNTPYGHLTVSVGVTSIGPSDLPFDDDSWLARADAALYRAKADGRNRCHVRTEFAPRAPVSDGTSHRAATSSARTKRTKIGSRWRRCRGDMPRVLGRNGPPAG